MKNLLPIKARKALLSLGAFLLALTSSRADAPVPPGLQAMTFQGQSFLIRIINPHTEDLRLYLNDDQGHPLNYFTALDKYISSKGEKLLFAANAGMFEQNSSPVGLLVLGSVEQSPININEGTGNFFMKPNGVFLINDKHDAMVVETSSYATLLNPVLWATQSGPLLVHGGDIHPEFNASSQNKKLRSGVGVTKEGMIIFALSKSPVSFYDFASFFLSKLKCPNALYLDGEISQFYVPGIQGAVPFNFGPMFGLVEKN